MDRIFTELAVSNDQGFVLDIRSGQRGSVEEWMAVFVAVWQSPKDRLEELLALLSDDVTLRAPTTPPVSHGKIASRAAFQRVFAAMPDLTADVQRWSFSGNALFVEMTFHASIGGHRVSWPNVDRFLFEDGVAIERVAHFNPGKLRKAYTRNLRALKQYLLLRRVKATTGRD